MNSSVECAAELEDLKLASSPIASLVAPSFSFTAARSLAKPPSTGTFSALNKNIPNTDEALTARPPMAPSVNCVRLVAH